MTIYVIGYDIHPSQGQTYDALEKAIQSFPDWWHCLDSTWLVKSDLSATQVRDKVWKSMYDNDRLLVVAYAPHNSDWIGFDAECSNWLKANM